MECWSSLRSSTDNSEADNSEADNSEADIDDPGDNSPPRFLKKFFFKSDPENARRFFGYNTRKEMLAWLKVHFPWLKETYSVRHKGKLRRLTDFEQACMARMYFRTQDTIGQLAALWETERRSCGKAIQRWAKKWEYVSKLWCRLTFSREYLLKCQVQGMKERYGLPISHLVDGTVCRTEHPRKNNASKKCMFNNKIQDPGTLALAHTSPTGLIFFATDMYGGNATEVDLVRIYRTWWSIYPRGFARLVDKGFARNTNVHYINGNKAIFPAFLTKKSAAKSASRTPQLTRQEVVDSSNQSEDRYVVETTFSRVKCERRLQGTVTHSDIKYINAAYLVGCVAANQLKPLRLPETWSSLEEDFARAKQLSP